MPLNKRKKKLGLSANRPSNNRALDQSNLQYQLLLLLLFEVTALLSKQSDVPRV